MAHRRVVTFSKVKGLSIVLGLFPLLMLGALPVQASVGVLVAPARIDLAVKPDDTTLERTLTIVNRGTSTNTFALSAVDLVIAQGVPEVLPAASTPYSSAAVTTLKPATITLAPGKSGTVLATFDVSGHRPLLGGLLVVPAQTTPADNNAGTGVGIGISNTPEALVTVSVGPVDATGELLPSVTVGLRPASLDLPWFAESGPLSAKATLRNIGNTYERVQSTYEFSNLGHAFLTVQAPPTSAMPGQTAITSATTRQRLEAKGQVIDAAPWLCYCEVRVSTVAWLAGRQTAPVIQTQTVLVFPWRPVGVILLGLLIAGFGFRWLRRRAIHR